MLKNIKFILSVIIFTAGCNNLYHGINSIPLIPFGTPVDSQALTIEYRYPTPGASGVTCNRMILVAFNKTIDPATVNNSTLSVTDSSGSVLGTTKLTENKFLIFTPATPPFTPLTTYTVTLANPVKDLQGRSFSGTPWSFITGTSTDSDRPNIIEAVPNAIFNPKTGITIQFNEPINPDTINRTNIIVTSPSGIVNLPILDYSASNNTILCTPSAIASGIIYTASVSGITDLAGNLMDPATYSWNFSSEALYMSENASNTTGDLGFGTFGDIDGAGGEIQGYQLNTNEGVTLSNYPWVNNSMYGAFTPGTQDYSNSLSLLVNGQRACQDLNLIPYRETFAPACPPNGLVSPPNTNFYIDIENGKFLLPRPIFWSKYENNSDFTNPMIFMYGHMPTVAGNACNWRAGKLNNCSSLESWTTDLYQRDEYPFGNYVPTDMGKGTISAWVSFNNNIFKGNGGTMYIQFGKNSQCYIQRVYGSYYGISLTVNGASNLPKDGLIGLATWHHIYIVWDNSGSLPNEGTGKTVKIYLDGNWIDGSDLAFDQDNIFIHRQSYQGFTAIDNLKIWNHVVNEYPAWEYNGGAGNEGGMHSIYGSTNNYKPVNIQVSYYRKP
ncbi:MAG: Ig-like domain-containing protein [Spirochaetes bacterium]|jgi:hypothetical protein|nr:Ig-like domain-containing protein [Spirochaetota bacterium]